MVEEIKVFPAELESHPFIDREALEYAEVKVHAVGVSERVSSYVSEGEPLRSRECGRIVSERSAIAGHIR